MGGLTEKQYEAQKASCDGLCDVTDQLVEKRDYMACVKCPFCHEVVTAELTPTTIHCPACKITVRR